MVSKDLQVQSLQEEEVKLKAQLARCQQGIGRYHVVGEGDEDGAAGWVIRGGLSHRARFSVCTRAVKVCVPFGPVSGITSEVFCLTVSVLVSLPISWNEHLAKDNILFLEKSLKYNKCTNFNGTIDESRQICA